MSYESPQLGHSVYDEDAHPQFNAPSAAEERTFGVPAESGRGIPSRSDVATARNPIRRQGVPKVRPIYDVCVHPTRQVRSLS